ncbi:MAG TPA: MmcQ/YjbR family DNA-binding protein [Pyrinomonadaceae bacterium]
MSPKAKPTQDGEKQIERVRRICLSLPETWEKISHGEPTWFVGKKVFAMFSNNHHGDGHIAVTIPAAIGIQEMLVKESPKKFYRPPYVGVRGWVGIEMDQVSDKELKLHLHEAWKLIAPAKIRQLGDLPKTSGRKTT